jgi:uncharacterized protein (DUF488 family)
MKKQITLYTIGFAQQKAKEFFTILKDNNIKTLIDIRQSNTNIYAGFTIRDNLQYFLKEICDIEYVENKHFAPTKELRDQYHKDEDWYRYENGYLSLLESRNAIASIVTDQIDAAVLLCSEPVADHCHRRLAVEYIGKHLKNVRIIHL